MRNLKKFLALVLAMMMAFSLVVTANATSTAGKFDDASGVTEAFQEGVDVVTGMKIFKGDAGTNDFRPSANIRRAEVAAIVYRLVTGDVNDVSAYLYTNVAPFTDVNSTDWFAGYVGYLWNAEIIKGSNEERTEFNPYGEVTGYEALAMVLRAMGYDENDEFTGGGWQIRVGQYANNIGLLDNVNATNYGAGHLNAAARRDTVAEILFQAATKPTVVYTPAYNYQTTYVVNGQNVDNDSLGHANFGLKSAYGVVVGNQATGESATKMGFDDSVVNAKGHKMWMYGVDAGSYFYGGTKLVNQNDPTEKVTGFVNSFDHTTPLTQFGHANKVWFNDSANSGGAGKYHTYAWFDKAYKTATVYVGEGTDDVNNDGSIVYSEAKSAGFGIPDTSKGEYLFGSDKYDRMGTLMDTLKDYETDDTDAIPVANKDDVKSPYIHMYSLVSNSADNNLDVVISLDAEVARIYDTDTTSSADRIVLKDSTLGQNTDTIRPGGHILTSHLTEDSVQTLGVTVEAWVVDGTILNSSKVAPDRDIDSYYETIAVKEGPSGLVSTIDSEGTVTLANGQQIKKSYLYNVVKSGVTQPASINAGENYAFVVDQWGRYLGLSSDPGFTFIYGTFADHSYGAVGSADLKYLVYGVDKNGGKIIDQPLTSMQIGRNDPSVFDALTGSVYNNIEIARRDYGDTTNGNQVAEGVYRGGVITADGKWWVNGEANFVDYAYDTVGKSDANWTFDSGDVANGFKDVSAGTDGKLLLTPNTVFYVVSGTGTASLNVKTYNGMKDFLDGASKVTIDPDYKNHDGDSDSYDVVYMTDADRYHSVGQVSTQNAMVTKVFVYEKAVDRVNNATLFYAHSNEATGLKIAGYEDDYSQFELWQGGSKVTYFVDNNSSIDTADRFYTLVKLPEQKNGVDVYAAEIVAQAPGKDASRTDVTRGGVCWSVQDFEYFATNDTSTARIGNVIYRVDNATVVDLTTSQARHNTGEASDHASHNQINNVKDLFNAISVGFDVNVSIVNDGVNASLIYVVDIVAPYT